MQHEEEKKKTLYEKPEVIHELELETIAGSPLNTDLNPFDWPE